MKKKSVYFTENFVQFYASKKVDTSHLFNKDKSDKNQAFLKEYSNSMKSFILKSII